jgi:hypothetical protein
MTSIASLLGFVAEMLQAQISQEMGAIPDLATPQRLLKIVR